MFWIGLQVILVVSIVAFFVVEILLPWLGNRKLFPSFRRSSKPSAASIQREINEKKEELETLDFTERLNRVDAKIRARKSGSYKGRTKKRFG